MILLENITKKFQTKSNVIVGVDDVTLSINKGEIYGIVGYSGAGKSTLLRCMNILERPSSGSVKIDGTDLLQLSNKDLRKARQSIGMIFQGFHLISSKTVFENVAFALKAAGIEKKAITKSVEELLEIVGLKDRINQFPAQLSGGQKQRVSIARALANNPKVLLCDEATSALDPGTTKSILTLLKRINQELGLTIVIITHEMEVVKEICHRCAVMQDGKVVEQGKTYDIFSNPQQPLTKTFIQTVLNFDLPPKLLQTIHGQLIKLQFCGDMAAEAVVSDMLQTFEVQGNILHGKIEYIQDTPLGIFIMEIKGEKQELDNALTYLRQRVNKVEVIVA
ncbi:methionine ABC transporter ATP-binding protein [Peribacillus psychrosaccharolyticus]|uniref:Methionine ABC transporter ATP-binding protein n=1 Tax=Peribacillus psychrosaccharolyticus TaxID=1407 RepID=A0A974RZR1_PERPY|nr:methionine ABC transporter ATP-binding protein [Peribacillus psychrosaccharolyticus]MEC2056943.1 methionine ABC transporter ATP-binding protein [Peribacillus psychrosaccharolyticus]MED3744865.1 methionine ABC transporter ATP-binding protein [Peribacillus psychrosaccharolyticus]QQS98509.1 methionine ABC transporter ATP-binding protein [Peribacillus psychrosaccharolyticus]